MIKYAALLLLGVSTVLAKEWPASAVVVRGSVRLCAVCEKPLARGTGFAPRNDVRADPEHVEALVIAVEGHLFPNHRPWVINATSREGWDVPVTFEFCELCDARFEARKKEVSSDAKVREELFRRLRESVQQEDRPNQSSEPTPPSVTTPAAQEIAPAAVVAHL